MWTNAKYNSKCVECRDQIEEGARIVLDQGKAYCSTCGPEIDDADPLDTKNCETEVQRRARQAQIRLR